MSALPVPARPRPFSSEVLDFAARNKVTDYLEPLFDVTWKLFPTARNVEVYVYHDPEIHDVARITFNPTVPLKDVPDFIAAVHRWYDEYFRIVPAPRNCTLGLYLVREA